ncbi:MAG TPA: MG2 domain-containing protein [Pyrinomonadaceae bacterium]|nr:MG2 domain-containing protein [Pyrinomonadaceae bacterium]
MTRRWLPLLLCLSVCLCAVHYSVARPSLRVSESAVRLILDDERTAVSLAVSNGGQSFAARAEVELLDPQDKVVSRGALDLTLAPGASNVLVPLDVRFDSLAGGQRASFPWFRLRYRVAAVAPAASGERAEGFVSISEAAPDIFELQVVTPPAARAGSRLRARARAAHPVSSRPVKGVRVEAKLDFGDDADFPPKTVTATTDSEGNAVLDFEVPRKAEDDVELTVKARRGAFTQEAEAEVDLDATARVMLTTDKTLYQPGQTLHLRGLLFDSSRRALAEEEVELEIQDQQQTTVFRTTLVTSRFGVVSADWPIPESAKLGHYIVNLSLEDDDRFGHDSRASVGVKVSRYDLPNFTVAVTPDRPYYLAGEDATVEVRGDYLFGRPVKGGSVRVVRETEREGDFKEQRYVTKAGAAVEGALAADGSFKARLDLKPEHAELAEAEYQRFRDLTYAAYITDPTTNRTEQRRFQLRLTKDPIHLYVVEGRFRQAEGMPLAFYVLASYADGRPAVCEVSIGEEGERDHAGEAREPLSLKVKTNRYGVARVRGPALALDGRPNLPLRFEARDREGRTGRHAEDFWAADSELRVETDKTLYRAGEPVVVEVTSSVREGRVFLDVADDDSRVVAARSARLRGGRASFTLPYAKVFKDRLTITATTADGAHADASERRGHYYDSEADFTSGSRSVVYPRNRELKLDVRFDKAEYKPGEEANAELSVRGPGGRRAEGALGVVVFDKAVEERARTDEEFAVQFGFGGGFRSFYYGSDAVGGVTRHEVEQLDLARPLPEGLDDAAEVLFNYYRDHSRPRVSTGTSFEKSARTLFNAFIESQFAPARVALQAYYARTTDYPKDEASLRRILAAAGVDFGAMLDPWGQPYRAEYAVEREEELLLVRSAGADERPGTDDDFTAVRLAWHYFTPAGEKVTRAVAEYHRRTGEHVREAATLREELRRAGVEFDALRDPWGRPYVLEFGVTGTNYMVHVVSLGPDGRAGPSAGSFESDDFRVWSAASDYFEATRRRVDAALAANFVARGDFPKDEATLARVLAARGVRLEETRDAWGRPYFPAFNTVTRYADRVTTESRGRYDSTRTAQRTEVTPVSQTVNVVMLFSSGADSQRGTQDDFVAGSFSSVAAEQSARDREPQAARSPTFSGGAGAIEGAVTDPVGAAVAGADVRATHQFTKTEYTARTDDEGRYLLRNLPSGVYDLSVEAPGFTKLTLTHVRVQSSNVTTVNMSVYPAAVTETVEVTSSAAPTVSTTSATVTTKSAARPAVAPRPQLSTPRLRQFFPETLVWQPALETDARGRASLRFKFADQITTWKVSVIGSTADGEVGVAEQEVRSFQPFFVEHEPPRVLTEGDEINLPVVLRNYLERAQPFDIEMKPEPWFALLGPARQRSEVASGEAAKPLFGFRAVASVRDGKQRVTAFGADASDAIEKPVSVHPDGEEVSRTAAQIFTRAGALEALPPPETIPGSLRAELKIYPNLSAHVLESVEGIMRRPYGCGEQTVSSTYPSLLVLRHYQHAGVLEAQGEAGRVVALARKYLREGYERLLDYRAPGGGFSYWGGTSGPDVALTAYALRFLEDARGHVEVDESVVSAARDWLARQQREDGSWPVTYYNSNPAEDARRTALQTAYVARVLAAVRERETPTAPDASQPNARAASPSANGIKPQANGTGPAPKADAPTPPTPLRRALRLLSRRVEEVDEPYLLASYALAALDAGDRREAARVAAKLRTLAREEGPGLYWSLETNTPFYGWGLAGRVETTALVLQALARTSDAAGGDPLVGRGLLFLMSKKDRHGVWLSTQATVNVLDTLLTLATPATQEANAPAVKPSPTGATAEVFVNGRAVASVPMPGPGELTGPLSVNLSEFLSPASASRVEVRRADASGGPAQAQLVYSYYVPWANSSAAPPGEHSFRQGRARSLSLKVAYDRTQAAVSDEITCRVEAARVGHGGYGMLLGEIGLPPGADVDRASLERAMKEAGWSFSRYDILPDRLVVYLWPTGGAVKFDFKFRPRFGLNAQSAPSQLYDYYNPEAHTLVRPTRFVVR